MLAAWDEDPRVIRFVDDIAAGIEPEQPVTYRYAAAISREPRRLGRPEYGLWKRRLLIDSGLVQPPDVALAVLPGGAGDQARRLWPSIGLLIQARVLGGTSADDPLPLSRRFLRRWVPMGEGSIRTGMEQLEAIEYVSRADTYRPKGGLTTILWQVRTGGKATVSLGLELPPAGATRHGG